MPVRHFLAGSPVWERCFFGADFELCGRRFTAWNSSEFVMLVSSPMQRCRTNISFLFYCQKSAFKLAKFGSFCLDLFLLFYDLILSGWPVMWWRLFLVFFRCHAGFVCGFSMSTRTPLFPFFWCQKRRMKHSMMSAQNMAYSVGQDALLRSFYSNFLHRCCT